MKNELNTDFVKCHLAAKRWTGHLIFYLEFGNVATPSNWQSDNGVRCKTNRQSSEGRRFFLPPHYKTSGVAHFFHNISSSVDFNFSLIIVRLAGENFFQVNSSFQKLAPSFLADWSGRVFIGAWQRTLLAKPKTMKLLLKFCVLLVWMGRFSWRWLAWRLRSGAVAGSRPGGPAPATRGWTASRGRPCSGTGTWSSTVSIWLTSRRSSSPMMYSTQKS